MISAETKSGKVYWKDLLLESLFYLYRKIQSLFLMNLLFLSFGLSYLYLPLYRDKGDSDVQINHRIDQLLVIFTRFLSLQKCLVKKSKF